MAGVWLIPVSTTGTAIQHQAAWIAGNEPVISAPREEEHHEALGREDDVTETTGIVKLDRGTISGDLIKGNGLTAAQWLARLRFLIKNQDTFYRVTLVSPSPETSYPKVSLSGLARLEAFTTGQVKSWHIELPFRARSS